MKYRLKTTQSIQDELNRDLKRNSLINCIVGAVGLFAYILVFGIIVALEIQPAEWVYVVLELALCVFVLMFSIGFVLLMSIKNVNKKALNTNSYGEYELYEDCFILKTFIGEEIINVGKVYYVDMIKIKETENYIFLYPTKQIAYVIPKKIFTKDELLTIKIWVYTPYLKKKGKIK